MLVGEDLFLLDESGRFLYRLATATGRGEPVSLDGLNDGIIRLAAADDRLWAVTDKGVWENRSGQAEQVLKADFGQDLLVGVFGSNFYLLDPTSWEIYRYPGTEGGFGERSRWLLEVVKKAGRPRRMAIDGQIWVLDERGDVFRLVRGIPESFSLESPREPIRETVGIALGTDRLYLLDQGGTRLLVFNQNGDYLEAYSWPADTKIKEMVVDRQNKAAWLLEEEKIYRLELK